MEGLRSSETSALTTATPHNIPEDDILTPVYNTQNNWVPGLWASSGILNNHKI
jgi:hypothetical protein